MKLVAGVLVLFVAGSGAAGAADDKEPAAASEKPNFKYKTVTTPEGLVFRVPEDMPIEKRAGILAPIPFDEYSYGKFAQIQDRLNKLETKLDKLQETLNQVLKTREAGAPSQPKEDAGGVNPKLLIR